MYICIYIYVYIYIYVNIYIYVYNNMYVIYHNFGPSDCTGYTISLLGPLKLGCVPTEVLKNGNY